MPNVSASIEDFNLQSAWTCKDGKFSVRPSQANAKKQFKISGIPDGGRITTATFTVTIGSPLSGIDVLKINGENASTGSFSQDVSAIIDGNGTFEFSFVFKAYGNASMSDGRHYGSLSFTNASVNVAYEQGEPEPEPEPEVILASKRMIVLFGPKEKHFKGNGICVLSPTSCVVREQAAGLYELELTHPFDQYGKCLQLKEDYIIRAPVPEMRTPSITLPPASIWQVKASVSSTPLYTKLPTYIAGDKNVETIRENPSAFAWDSSIAYSAGKYCIYNGGIYQADESMQAGINPNAIDARNKWVYRVKLSTSESGSSAGDESASGGKYDPGVIAENLSGGEMITKIADFNRTYIQVRSLRGITGYVRRDKCEETQQETAGQTIPPRTIIDQLFRIYAVNCEIDTKTVTVSARHISYDFQKNSLYDCKLNNVDPVSAIAIVQGSLMNEDDRLIACDMTEPLITADYSFQNPVQAIFDPDDGIAAFLHARVLRDNKDIFLLDGSNPRKGPDIVYGKNLRGVTWTRSIENVITRIVPRADDGNGGYLYLEEMFVDSPHVSEYGVESIYVLDTEWSVGQEIENADGTTQTLSRDDVLKKMREDADNCFSVNGWDKPELTLDVQFLLLGDTEQYKQYKGLQRVNLYDKITVQTGPSGLEAITQVVGYEWDCLLFRYNEINVGVIGQKQAATIPGYQLSTGAVSGRVLSVGAVSGSNLRDNSVTEGVLAANAVTARVIAADDLVAINAKLGTAEIAKAQITTANIQEANIDWASITTLSAVTAGIVDAHIGTASIDFAQIKDASLQNLIARDAVTDRYFIDKLQVRNVQAVQATVGDLVVKASNGNYYRLDVSANGSLTPTQVTPTAAQIASGQMGNGAIIETDLTVADLSASNLKAINALIDKITASRIDVDELFARNATITKLNTVDISGNQSLRLMVQGRSKNYTQWDEPTGTASEPLKDGDIWDKTSGIRTWAELGELTWAEASAYPWWAFTGSKQYIRRGNQWVLMTDEVSLRETQAQILLEQDNIRLSVAQKYGMQSGIDILAAGIEISGGKYVRIKSGGLFTVDSGNFSIDSSGNVTMTGTVNAGAGSVIGGWTLGANRLHSGSGTDYVALDSDASGTYAIWAGNATASSAPFRVTRTGKVYLTSLATVDEQGNETIINLSNRNSSYPLWKLNYATVKNITVANNTLTIETTGGTVNFSKAVRVATSAGDIDVGSLGPDPGGLQEHVTVYYDDGQHTANVPIVVAGTQTLYSRGAASVGVRSWSVDKSAMPTVTVTVTLTNGEVRSYSFNV